MRLISLVFVIRMALVLLLGAALCLTLLSKAQNEGTFEDDDPTNDPNTCHSDPDPPNCDWKRGWFQAALNVGHVTLEGARSAYPDIHVTDWLPVYAQVEQQRQKDLFEDEDPSNDPNVCHTSDDPNCDWNRGWLEAFANLYKLDINVDFEYEKGSDGTEDVVIRETGCGTTQILLGLSAELAKKYPDAYKIDCDPTLIRETRWFCPEGYEPDNSIIGPNCDKKIEEEE